MQAQYYNKHRLPAPEYQRDQLVWLLRRNIKTTRPSGKLDHRRLGPYPIIHKIYSLAYQLALPFLPTLDFTPFSMYPFSNLIPTLLNFILMQIPNLSNYLMKISTTSHFTFIPSLDCLKIGHHYDIFGRF